MEKINLEDKFDSIDEYWSPGIIGKVNNMEVKLAKVKGNSIRTITKKMTNCSTW